MHDKLRQGIMTKIGLANKSYLSFCAHSRRQQPICTVIIYHLHCNNASSLGESQCCPH